MKSTFQLTSLYLHNGTNNKAEVKNILLDSILLTKFSDKFYSNSGPKIREVDIGYRFPKKAC